MKKTKHVPPEELPIKASTSSTEQEVKIVDRSVPEIDVNRPLPEEHNAEIQPDLLMTVAKRQWHIGIGVFCVFLIVVGFVGWGYSRRNTQKQNISATTVETTPIPTIAPIVVKVKPTFAVWNGSGIAGAAGKMANTLKAAGYDVIEVKNSPKIQTGTTVEISTAMLDQKEEILQIVGVEDFLPLADTDVQYSVKIVIGK